MIRRATYNDINEIMRIWLETNISAHSFISSDYWKVNFNMVKDAIWEAEVYVAEIEKQIVGFVGLAENHIEGLFVEQAWQKKGVGTMLTNYVKQQKEKLTLDVYLKNTSAVCFYKRQKFIITDTHINENTNEKEYLMVWDKSF